MEGQHRINLTWSADSRDDGYEDADADADEWMPVLEMNGNIWINPKPRNRPKELEG